MPFPASTSAPSVTTKTRVVQTRVGSSQRVVTTTDEWNTYKQYLDISSQMDCIREIHDFFTQSPQLPLNKTSEYIQRQLRSKRSGYRSQDTLKHLYDETAFITEPEIVELLLKSEFKCFYCKEPVEVLYENVRHPKQWSLERIDNTLGHNRNNVEIACLSCNLRRRTMYYERYLATKQMRVVVKV